MDEFRVHCPIMDFDVSVAECQACTIKKDCPKTFTCVLCGERITWAWVLIRMYIGPDLDHLKEICDKCSDKMLDSDDTEEDQLWFQITPGCRELAKYSESTREKTDEIKRISARLARESSE